MQALWFILLVGVLVLVHELGHFAVARLCGIRVLRLSLGFGPQLVGARWHGTEYVLSAVPLGGYVRLLGEDPSDEVPVAERERSFSARPLWQRVAVVLAGPAANLVFPVLLYAHYYGAETTTLAATIGTVFEGQPAAGVLEPGDTVVAVDDRPVRDWDDFARQVAAAPGRDLRVTVERPGDERALTRVLTPRARPRRDLLGDRVVVGQLGVSPRARLAQIGLAAPDCPAAQAGLRSFDIITSVRGWPVSTWGDLDRALRSDRGQALLVTYLRPKLRAGVVLPLVELQPGSAQIFPARVVGPSGHVDYDTGIRSAELYVYRIEPGSPAAQAGIHPGDVLTRLDGQPLVHWETLELALDEHPDRELRIEWRTPDGATRQATLRPRASRATVAQADEEPHPVFGAEPSRATRPARLTEIDGRLGRALRLAVETTAQVTAATARVYSRLLTLRLPATMIGGPIMIYHLTGVAVARGADELLAMLALLSLNLGLLNLLPLPVLDGGHLLFLGIEAVRRRPLGPRVRARAVYVGIALLTALTLLAARNDVIRYWFVP